MPSKLVVHWTTWSASTFHRCYGRRYSAAFPLAGWTAEACGGADLAAAVAAANTARHALEILRASCPQVMAAVGRRIIAAARKFASGAVEIRSVIFDYDGTLLFADPPAENGRPRSLEAGGTEP